MGDGGPEYAGRDRILIVSLSWAYGSRMRGPGLARQAALGRDSRAPLPTSSLSLQEHQTVVYQMIQQIQQKRELQRLQMAGGSQLPMASLLAGSSTPLLSAGTPGLLPTASAPPLLPAGALVAPSLGSSTSLMAAAAAAAAVAAAGGPPVLTAQTNPFVSLPGADASGNGPKGGVSRGLGPSFIPVGQVEEDGHNTIRYIQSGRRLQPLGQPGSLLQTGDLSSQWGSRLHREKRPLSRYP